MISSRKTWGWRNWSRTWSIVGDSGKEGSFGLGVCYARAGTFTAWRFWWTTSGRRWRWWRCFATTRWTTRSTSWRRWSTWTRRASWGEKGSRRHLEDHDVFGGRDAAADERKGCNEGLSTAGGGEEFYWTAQVGRMGLRYWAYWFRRLRCEHRTLYGRSFWWSVWVVAPTLAGGQGLVQATPRDDAPWETFPRYQPGGLAEKSLILTSLEGLRQETSIQSAVQSLRRWIRWRRRAADVQVSMPDPTVLMKGLSKMTKKVMSQHPELHFASLWQGARFSWIRFRLTRRWRRLRTTSWPRWSKQDRKARDGPSDGAKIKEMRSFETVGDYGKSSGKGKGKDKEKGPAVEKADGPGQGDQKCRFYLKTESGCRKGRDCTWSHDQADGQRRCYGCGSTQHLLPQCPRKTGTGSSQQGSPQRPKAAKVTEEAKEDVAKPPSEAGTSSTEGETAQNLLLEANRMLKSLGRPREPEITNEDRLKALQQQLEEMKMKVKTLRLTRITNGDMTGLIDSGATHPMRGFKKGENTELYEKVEVILASGKKEALRMTLGGVMVVDTMGVYEGEPIVPFGTLVTRLGCKVRWEHDGRPGHSTSHQGQVEGEHREWVSTSVSEVGATVDSGAGVKGGRQERVQVGGICDRGSIERTGLDPGTGRAPGVSRITRGIEEQADRYARRKRSSTTRKPEMQKGLEKRWSSPASLRRSGWGLHVFKSDARSIGNGKTCGRAGYPSWTRTRRGIARMLRSTTSSSSWRATEGRYWRTRLPYEIGVTYISWRATTFKILGGWPGVWKLGLVSRRVWEGESWRRNVMEDDRDLPGGEAGSQGEVWRWPGWARLHVVGTARTTRIFAPQVVSFWWAVEEARGWGPKPGGCPTRRLWRSGHQANWTWHCLGDWSRAFEYQCQKPSCRWIRKFQEAITLGTGAHAGHRGGSVSCSETEDLSEGT